MSASPAATPVTTPLALTLATPLFDEDHVAVLVTDCVVPSDKAAAAENCEVAPARGADPETATETTVGADGVLTDEGAVGAGLPAQAWSSQPAATPADMIAPQRAASVNGLTIGIVRPNPGPYARRTPVAAVAKRP